MDPKDNKPSTPSRRAKKEESEYLEADECRTAVETESLTDARISRVPPPVTQSPRDAWANVAPSSQPRIVPATTRLSQADREAEEIATSTARALQTLRNSSDPRNRLFVPQSPAAAQTTPKRAASTPGPFQAFSGQGRPLVSPLKAGSSSTGVRTAIGASPAPSSVRTAAARSPDVRTGLEHSGRSARLREQRAVSQSPARATRSDVSTALSGRATPKKARKPKGGCATLHTATANYEIDLRQRSNSMTAPTTSVSTARTISPAARSSRTGRSPARPLVASNQQAPYYDPDYPPLPCERDPTEQTVELVDQSQKYTPHIARPILFGTSGVNTARNISPGRTRTLSERTALGDTSLKTSRSPASKSEKSVRTARSQHGGPSAGNNDASSKRAASRKASVSRSHHKSQSQSSLATTSARSFASNKSWATEPNKTPCRKNLRSAHKSVSETPTTITGRSDDFSNKSSSASRGPRKSSAAKSKAKTPLRTAAGLSNRSPAPRTAISPDVKSSKRSPIRTGRAPVRPFTPNTPKGWPYITSEQQRQTPIRIAAPAATSVKTAAARSPRPALKSTKSPALRSQKEIHREAKSASSKSRSNSRRAKLAKPASKVSTARPPLASRPRSSNNSSKSSKELDSSKINARTLSPETLKAAKRNSVAAIDNSPDMVIETVQAHGNIEIDLCFNFRVRGPPGQGFGESTSPLKPKEVLINGKRIWRQ